MVKKPIDAPCSGEILVEDRAGAGTARTAAAFPHAAQIIDAEYETLPGRFEAAPSQAGSPPATALAGLECLRGGTAGRTAPPAIPGILGLLAVAATFWLSGGYALLEHVRPTATTGPSLDISALESRIERLPAGDLLIIDGEAVNEGGASALLPDLSINILGVDGHTTRYFLGTNGTALSAGERFAFSSRLAAPKDGVRSVSVTFRE